MLLTAAFTGRLRDRDFETKAEIAMMSRYVDLVGMTMGSEAVIAQELGLAYASICSVDNYAHGLGEKALTMDEIVRMPKETPNR